MVPTLARISSVSQEPSAGNSNGTKPKFIHDQKSGMLLMSFMVLWPMRPFSCGTEPLNAKFAFSCMSKITANSCACASSSLMCENAPMQKNQSISTAQMRPRQACSWSSSSFRYFFRSLAETPRLQTLRLICSCFGKASNLFFSSCVCRASLALTSEDCAFCDFSLVSFSVENACGAAEPARKNFFMPCRDWLAVWLAVVLA
mmetsp:Transcript_91534/g.238528  ORF Transcript_91534/g.238528 Transcript_91534/m.238528 type:complete len:202 (+) Transcript_91534:366-971(+)